MLFFSTTKNNKVIAEKPFQNSGVTRRLAILNWRSSSICPSSSYCYWWRFIIVIVVDDDLTGALRVLQLQLSPPPPSSSSSLVPILSRMEKFWYRLTRIVLENGC